MAEAIDIRELNVRIEQQSGFVTNLVTGMDRVIVGQKHLVDSLLIGLLSAAACRRDRYDDLLAERREIPGKERSCIC